MIAALLTFIGLFLSFYDKINLFKKPITKTRYCVIVLLIGAAVLSFVKDIIEDGEKEESKKVILSLNTKASVLSDIIRDLRNESKVAQKAYTDSIVNYHNYTTELLARYSLKVDTINNQIRNFDTTISKETPPTLIFSIEPTYLENNNENSLVYELKSLNSNVHLLYYYYTFINTKGNGNSLVMTGNPVISEGGSLNFSTIIPTNDKKGLTIFLDRIIPKDFNDSLFLAIEIVYKSKGNVRQTPVRKVYFLDNLNKNSRAANNYEFVQVANYLKKKKIWKRFYDL